jgi:hypothetical protein
LRRLSTRSLRATQANAISAQGTERESHPMIVSQVGKAQQGRCGPRLGGRACKTRQRRLSPLPHPSRR